MNSILSPLINELAEQLQNENEQTLHQFLDEMKTNETPLIEICPMNEGYRLITYLWLGDEETENVYVCGSYPGWDLTSNKLEKLLHTNLWYKTFRTNEQFVSTYYFSVNDYFEHDWVKRSKHYQLDQFNSKTFGTNPDKASFLELGTAIQYDKTYFQNHIPHGEIETYSFYSSALGNARKLIIYTPRDYSRTSTPQDLVITFDGSSFMQNLSAAITLDNLIYKKEIPSCIVVGMDHVDRFAELTYNDKMNSFLKDELLPWIQTKYHVQKDPTHITIAGLSLGGLAAFYAALQYPHVFGNVLSLSGSVHRKKDGYEDTIPWIEQKFLTSSSKYPFHTYMAAGALENKSLLEANRSLYKTLKENEYQITYLEFSGGHDEIWWRELFAEGLLALYHSKKIV
ncbi:alpha/beta hydrolase-fold protein [Bacillus sp. DX1.1]|uniref:alpha/beta hydrolase n=1 Tax=unclassified Bacillus (in: firmicutes) TaxID=185979 RepID=UPI0025705AF4|nr:MULTISPECIES: alpha/beta hydrolase-fold protein [unclassified Bacillus (in: firmicutes)]MDM5155082.1 alpha/beta hydrolase-fold protein [Bacillus sp. DX1.1]WJE83939.1 alpha/beta hydrolase-fold protein [Bacillus sp. DX3.1]